MEIETPRARKETNYPKHISQRIFSLSRIERSRKKRRGVGWGWGGGGGSAPKISAREERRGSSVQPGLGGEEDSFLCRHPRWLDTCCTPFDKGDCVTLGARPIRPPRYIVHIAKSLLAPSLWRSWEGEGRAFFVCGCEPPSPQSVSMSSN